MAVVQSTSAHVIPQGRQWFLFKPNGRRAGVFSTQREAVSHAKQIVERASVGQVVVHSSNGGFRVSYSTGLPKLARIKGASTSDRVAVRRAISSTIRERLLSD